MATGIPQTSYSYIGVAGSVGEFADTDDVDVGSYVNGEAGDLPLGVACIEGAAGGGQANLPSAAGQKFAGVVVDTYGRDPNGLTTGSYLTGNPVPLLRRGRCFVVAEEAVSATDPVYIRIAPSVNTPALVQKGGFRKSPDGVAGVLTVTPTPVNSTIYTLRVEVGGQQFTFEAISSGAATATTIVTQLKALMAADAEFTALVTASGTTTLILTGVVPGAPILAQSEGDGALAVAITTPPAPTAVLLKGASYRQSAIAGGLTIVEVSVPASRT